MIYTLTFNPALDYVITTPLEPGTLNKVDSEEIIFGGKGINVSRVLNNFNIPTTCLGFISGFTGLALEEFLQHNLIKTDFIKLSHGFTRINVKLNNGILTEINGNGPDIDRLDIAHLTNKLEKLVEGDTLVISGSVPKSVPLDIYNTIVAYCNRKGVKVCVDAVGELLVNSLSAKPYLIKPKRQVVEAIFEKKLFELDDVKEAAMKLHDMGARNVIITLNDQGAFILTENLESYFVGAPEGIVFNTVGSGDSLLAGFLYGKEIGLADKEALTLGVYAGSATVFSNDLCTKKEVIKLLDANNVKLF